ncbi:MAG TPA: nucleoside 2-deoxyribosyltransferase [Pyrinomonadaceae bacterium]|nr:nucleoside 2-deoxyribosyltransferase [Pyrinomonadaceae bacterium]
METEAKSTKPKPFIFVLMPFDTSFDDIYKFGIKGAAEDAGAYAERVDEQIFGEGILERVFNQINKADVVVADMTGRNPNVFYEVGYAHALGRIVFLLTQNASDIPFDLKHHQHTVYGGKIETLRKELATKIEWAIRESRKAQTTSQKAPYEISTRDIYLLPGLSSEQTPVVLTIIANGQVQDLSFIIRNSSTETLAQASYIYLFADESSVLQVRARYKSMPGLYLIQYFNSHPSDAPDGLSRQYRLPNEIPVLPPGASETLTLGFSVPINSLLLEDEEPLRLRIHTGDMICDYRFKLAIQEPDPVS